MKNKDHFLIVSQSVIAGQGKRPEKECCSGQRALHSLEGCPTPLLLGPSIPTAAPCTLRCGSKPHQKLFWTPKVIDQSKPILRGGSAACGHFKHIILIKRTRYQQQIFSCIGCFDFGYIESHRNLEGCASGLPYALCRRFHLPADTSTCGLEHAS